jgi:hypothetical protein
MNTAERCASRTDPQGTHRLIIQAQKGMNQVTTYCKKCSDEARKQGLKPREVLMRNSKCILCGETNICLDCHEKQGIPTIACINCLEECDRYIKGIDQVNENINSTLRLREAQGWKPNCLVIDSTFRGGGLESQPLEAGDVIRLEPEPRFAVAMMFKMDDEARIDFVELCPVSMKKLLKAAVCEERLPAGTTVHHQSGR